MRARVKTLAVSCRPLPDLGDPPRLSGASPLPSGRGGGTRMLRDVEMHGSIDPPVARACRRRRVRRERVRGASTPAGTRRTSRRSPPGARSRTPAWSPRAANAEPNPAITVAPTAISSVPIDRSRSSGSAAHAPRRPQRAGHEDDVGRDRDQLGQAGAPRCRPRTRPCPKGAAPQAPPRRTRLPAAWPPCTAVRKISTSHTAHRNAAVADEQHQLPARQEGHVQHGTQGPVHRELAIGPAVETAEDDGERGDAVHGQRRWPKRAGRAAAGARNRASRRPANTNATTPAPTAGTPTWWPSIRTPDRRIRRDGRPRQRLP